MSDNELLNQVYEHRKLVNATVTAFVSSDYLLHHLEDPAFREREAAVALFEKALKRQMDLLSLDEYEQFMTQNDPYWQVYQNLFLRYRNLNELTN